MATAALSGVSPSAAGDTGADPSGPSATQTVTFSDLVEVSRQHQIVTMTDPQTGQPDTGPALVVHYTTEDTGFVSADCQGFASTLWKHHIQYGGAAATAYLNCG